MVYQFFVCLAGYSVLLVIYLYQKQMVNELVCPLVAEWYTGLQLFSPAAGHIFAHASVSRKTIIK